MKKVAFVASMILASLVLVACATEEQAAPAASAPAAPASSGPGDGAKKNKKTTIYMTRNPLIGGGYDATCLGAIVTERIGTLTGDTVTWKIKNGNGESNANEDDKCDPFDPQKVELRFDEEVMKGGKTLKSTNGNSIEDEVTGREGVYGYRVYYMDTAGAMVPAGPDPEIIVNCDSCTLPGSNPPGGK